MNQSYESVFFINLYNKIPFVVFYPLMQIPNLKIIKSTLVDLEFC